MKDSIQTAQDIFHRNKFSSPFHLKIPSHHASKQFINILLNTHILNKLALLPFYQQQKFALLYKGSLEYLLHLAKDKYKSAQFMKGLLLHLENWEVNMSAFDSWRYTRAVFYCLQEKAKQNQQLKEEIMLKRAILQPSKQEFLKKSQNTTFKNQHLKSIKSITKDSLPPSTPTIVKVDDYSLPEDILLIDDNQSWRRLGQLYSNKGELRQQKVEEYVAEYEKSGVVRYLKNRMKQKVNVGQILGDLELRNTMVKLVTGSDSTLLSKVISNIKKRSQTI